MKIQLWKPSSFLVGVGVHPFLQTGIAIYFGRLAIAIYYRRRYGE